MTTKLDRAVPFSLSLPLSHIERMERVLSVAAAQGMLTSPPTRTNRLAAELLMQHVMRLENDFRAAGLLPPAAPLGAGMSPASAPIPDSARLATDPNARAKARAAHGFKPEATTDLDEQGGTVLEEPPGVNWDNTL